MSERIKKVNEILKRETGMIVEKEVDLPKGVFLTITKVDTARDLKGSKLYVSVFPEDRTGEVLGILSREIYGIQQVLNRRIKIRYVPKIRFLEDKQLEKARKIEDILETLKKREE
jgi:ribosome-binding factor A